MRIILIALFSFVSLVLIGQDQTVDNCDPICGGPVSFSAACADDQGGGAADYTYTTTIGSVSAAGIVTITQADIDALPTGTTQIIVDVTCVCIDLGCVYTTEYIIPIQQETDILCFATVNSNGFPIEDDCSITVCEGDSFRMAFRDNPNTIGFSNTVITGPLNFPSGISGNIIAESGVNDGTYTWTYTSPDGCVQTGEFEVLIKVITQEAICPN